MYVSPLPQHCVRFVLFSLWCVLCCRCGVRIVRPLLQNHDRLHLCRCQWRTFCGACSRRCGATEDPVWSSMTFVDRSCTLPLRISSGVERQLSGVWMHPSIHRAKSFLTCHNCDDVVHTCITQYSLFALVSCGYAPLRNSSGAVYVP
jgi:hypothetical protein